MNTPDTLELARLCWPDEDVIHTTGEKPSVRVEFGFKEPYILNRFDPSTDWNDAHRVMEIINEHELFAEWVGALNGSPSRGNLDALSFTSAEWATAALQVLRAQEAGE